MPLQARAQDHILVLSQLLRGVFEALGLCFLVIFRQFFTKYWIIALWLLLLWTVVNVTEAARSIVTLYD